MEASPFDSLLQDLAKKDFLTYQHSISVAEKMKFLAKKMGLDDSVVDDAEKLGAIHDLAKIKISGDLFKKLQSGKKLEEAERIQLKQDPATLLDLLKGSHLSKEVQTGIEQMHCHFDGSGQPGLKGDQIHPLARMLTVVDYGDFLTRQRTGKTPMTEKQTHEVLLKNKGRLFDPKIVSSFIQN